MEENRYFLEICGEVRGPYTIPEIWDMYENDMLTLTTNAAAEGTEIWRPLWKVFKIISSKPLTKGSLTVGAVETIASVADRGNSRPKSEWDRLGNSVYAVISFAGMMGSVLVLFAFSIISPGSQVVSIEQMSEKQNLISVCTGLSVFGALMLIATLLQRLVKQIGRPTK